MSYISFQPKDYFNTKLWTGTGSSNAITGVGFQPDWVWIKNRSATESHRIHDAVRGTNKSISSDTNSSQTTTTQDVMSFDSDGFTLGTETAVNANGQNIVGWNWKANGQGSSNTDGTINSTYTSANTTSGFSIVTYTSGGGSGTVGHGMNSIPKVMFYKPLSTSGGWDVYHHSLGISNRLNLHNNSASSSGYFQTLPTSSVFTEPNLYSGESVIMYCFAEKKGFSKFGSYTGNGSATDGTFVYTGFVPAFVICKVTSTTDNWMMFTNKIGSSTDSTSGFNIHSRILEANGSGAEQSVGSGQGIDFVSNGFKIREDNGNLNGSGATYIYLAFAEEPLVSSNSVPAVAR